jgi:DNA-binding CsgD family transcriptional regulator
MFKALGLSPSEEDLYAVLVHSPRSTVAELAAYGCVSSQQATRDLQNLVRQGLANRLPGKQARYIAVAPDIAIEPLLTRREDELRQARLGASDLMKAFRQASRQDHPAELVEIITGEGNIRSRTDQFPLAAREQIRGFDRPPYIMAPEENITQEANQIREGITYRVVYSAQAVMWPGRVEGDIRDALAAGEQVRVRPDLPTKLWLVDDTMAMIPINTQQQGIGAAFIVRPCDLLDALIAMFEAEWDRAIPLRSFLSGDSAADASEPDETRTAVLSCLAAGLTDEGIARSLGCSLRTAQRHIRRIMQDLNVSSRFQAGMEARQRGWV